MLAYIVMDGSPNFSENASCSKDQYKSVRVYMIKAWRCYRSICLPDHGNERFITGHTGLRTWLLHVLCTTLHFTQYILFKFI